MKKVLTNVEIMDRLVGILFRHDTELLTTERVAELFGESIYTIYKYEGLFEDEFISDGVLDTGIWRWNRRSILRIGMVLQNNTLAEAIKSYLLNVVEKEPKEYF